MHASYVSLLVLVASAAVPALSAPLSARNIVANREPAHLVARTPVIDSVLPVNTNTTNPFTNTDLSEDKFLQLLLNGRSEDESTSLDEDKLLKLLLSGRSEDESTSLNEDKLLKLLLSGRSEDESTSLNEDKLLKLLLSGRSEGESTSLNRRNQTSNSLNPNLADLLVLSALSSRGVNTNEELQARNFLTSLLGNFVGSPTFLKVLGFLGRRDVDNRSSQDEELQARGLFSHLFQVLESVIGFRDVTPGEVGARDLLEASTQLAARNQTLTPEQLLTLALLSQ